MTILVDGELVLYGFVGDSFWDSGFTALDVVEALAELGRDADVAVRINSGGGYIDDGIAIYNALVAHRGDVTVYIDAVAASSASVIAMAGDKIVMRKGAQMMIHEPAGGTFGSATDHQKTGDQLDKLADLMAEIYAEKSGEDVDDIRAEMKQELWLTGAEAVDRGYATEIEGGKVKAVAAFDFSLYSQAPSRLVAMAKKKKWSFEAAQPKAAPVAKSPKPQKETPPMGTPEISADDIRADVKARIKAITGDDAAKGQTALAEHFAYDTDLSAEAAIAALKTAAPGKVEASDDGDGKGGDGGKIEGIPDPATYQASRQAARDLAPPAGGKVVEDRQDLLSPTNIYAKRRKATALAGKGV